MAVFKVEKTKNFTIMSNHHLQNKNLSLKAKGLLSYMLSLPMIGTTPLQELLPILNKVKHQLEIL